jgi:hypothetical protein
MAALFALLRYGSTDCNIYLYDTFGSMCLPREAEALNLLGIWRGASFIKEAH